MIDQPLGKTLTVAPVLLEVKGVTVEFVSKDKPPARAVDAVSFVLRKGEMLGLVGESGCGKTTLMLSLMRLLPEAGRIVAGQMIFQGRDLLSLTEKEMAGVRWKDLSIVFQGAMNALNPVRTVGDQIAEALVRHGLAGNKKAAVPRVGELLELVGIGAAARTSIRINIPAACASGR